MQIFYRVNQEIVSMYTLWNAFFASFRIENVQVYIQVAFKTVSVDYIKLQQYW